jgi:acyl-CoA synthetase (AMP-forming)/AMP-acid ligase II
VVLTGGRHLSPRAVRAATARLGDVVHLYYATTETGINTMAPPAELAREPRSAGFPMPGVAVRIVDRETRRDVPAGALGLIAVASPVNMDGYAHGGEPPLERDGRRWIVTGDLGRLGSRGELRIAGRSDGFGDAGSVDVVALEGQLKELPGVDDVCVVRRLGRTGVEVVAAVVAADRAAPRAVRDRLGRLLTGGASTVIPIPAIPYNTAGKVDLRRLHPLLDGAGIPA